MHRACFWSDAALGSMVAELLARAGVGHLVIVDRDVVEWTNLQRQILFDESHAESGEPKAVAAALRLAQINSHVVFDPRVMDVHSGNVESLSEQADLIVDGTDNAETRYLLNDVAVKRDIPWVYGACVGTVGRMLMIRPGKTPCLACVFPEPPGVGELETCDTAGVLGPAIAVVAGFQAAAAIKLLSGHPESTDAGLLTIDFWTNRQRTIDIGGRRAGCTCCDERRFIYLDRPAESNAAALCGRNSVQVRPASAAQIDLKNLATKLSPLGVVESSRYLLRFHIGASAGITLTVFSDGRCIVQGTNDLSRTRTLVSQYVGS